MKIRKLRPHKKESEPHEPLVVVKDSLGQMEQILTEHFYENDCKIEKENSRNNWIDRLSSWILDLLATGPKK